MIKGIGIEQIWKELLILLAMTGTFLLISIKDLRLDYNENTKIFIKKRIPSNLPG